MKQLLFVFFIALVSLSGCKTTKDTDNAGKSDKKALVKAPRGFDDKFFSATKARITGDYDNAIKLYQECISIWPQSAVSYYELSRLQAMYLKNQNLALENIKKAIQNDSQNPWYTQFCSEIFFNMGKYEESAKMLEKTVALNSSNIEIYYDWANAYIYAKKYDNAIEVYDKLENKIGITEEISLQKEKIYLSLNKPNDAAKELEKLVNQFPTNVQYLEMLAELYTYSGKTEKAQETYQKIAKLDPENVSVFLLMADQYASKGDRVNSLTELKKAFSSSRMEVDAKMKILLQYFDLSQKDPSYKEEAYQLIGILIKAHPADPKAYTIYGDFLMNDKRTEEAKIQFEKVLTLDSSRYAVWEQLLFIYSELSDTPSMLEKSKAAMELFPLQPVPYLFHGIANRELKNYDEAIAAFTGGKSLVVENSKLSAEFYNNLGEIYNIKKMYAESDEAFEQSIFFNNSNAYVLNNYSYYLAMRGEKLSRALELAKRACLIEPNNPSFLDTYGWVLYKQGNYAEALNWIGKALANDSKSAVLMEHYGDALYKSGKPDEAYEYWIKAKQAGKGSGLLEQKITEKKLIE